MNFLENLGESIEKMIENKNDRHIVAENIKNDQGARPFSHPFSQEEIELAKKLDAIEEFTIDRIEEDKVVLEDRKTRKMINVDKNKIPNTAVEGDILKRINGKYIIDNDKIQEVSDRIKKKMDDLWN